MSSLCRHVHGRHEQSRNKQTRGPMPFWYARVCRGRGSLPRQAGVRRPYRRHGAPARSCLAPRQRAHSKQVLPLGRPVSPCGRFRPCQRNNASSGARGALLYSDAASSAGSTGSGSSLWCWGVWRASQGSQLRSSGRSGAHALRFTAPRRACVRTCPVI
jgi:hypothetical protein